MGNTDSHKIWGGFSTARGDSRWCERSKAGVQQWEGDVCWLPSSAKSFRMSQSDLDCISGGSQMDQSFSINPKKGTDHSLILVFSWTFHCRRSHVAMKGAEGMISSWRAQNTHHKEDSKSLPTNFSQPWIQPRPHSWTTHWSGFSLHSKDRKTILVSAGWGPCWWDPSGLYSKQQWARQIL